MNTEDFLAQLGEFVIKILPYLVSFMGFALPIAFFMGDLLKSAIAPMSEYFPKDSLYIYIVIAIAIFILGGFLNYKYPYRRVQKKEFD